MSLAPSRTIYSITPCSYPDPVGAVGFTASFGGWQREYNISPGPRNTKKKTRKKLWFYLHPKYKINSNTRKYKKIKT